MLEYIIEEGFGMSVKVVRAGLAFDNQMRWWNVNARGSGWRWRAARTMQEGEV